MLFVATDSRRSWFFFMLQVLGRVRRLLSVQEPPDLRAPQRLLKRHSSDATGSFFPDFRYSVGSSWSCHITLASP